MKTYRLYRYLLPFWKQVVLLLALSLLGMVLSLVNPYLIKLVVDKAYANRDLNLFFTLIILIGIVYISAEFFKGLSKYLTSLIKIRLDFSFNKKLFKKLQSLSYAFFQNTSIGQHLVNVSRDIEEVSRFIVDSLPQLVLFIPRTIIIILLVLRLNWQMAFLSLLLAPFLHIISFYYNRRLERAWRRWIENYEIFFSRLQESLSHVQLIKAFGKERSETKRYVSTLIKNARAYLGVTKLQVAGSFASSIVNHVFLGLIIFYGGYQVIKENMSLGSLSAITIYLSQLSGLQGSLTNFFQQMAYCRVSHKRLESIFNEEPEQTETQHARKFTFPCGKIEFQNITFRFKPDEKVLEGLGFTIAGSSCIGLAGYSGCGKTTISNLLLRLYGPLKGKIFIDGFDISNIQSKSFYAQISAVLQEPYLWNDTIEYNIKYGGENITAAQVREAAKIACIDNYINSLKDGYRTIIGENACKISEGQKQRIAIARAIVRRPKIVILDEALSSVNISIEGKIIDSLRGYLANSTFIVISHRLSTIKKMDLIYFLTGPDNIDIGTHESLLARSARYRAYLAHQQQEGNEHCQGGQVVL
jgi:ABC-type bacteriocin/lantibiotic exporter with double-glycine peptidase domain